MNQTPALMTTHEVAEYLRIKERKVYDLIAQRQIPCTRAAGKWLFPRELIDVWLLGAAQGPATSETRDLPAILTGSHDPLLDWAVRESRCGLAVLFDGSLDGLERFTEQSAQVCGIHVLDPQSASYNTPILQQRLASAPVVAIEWAQRQQGLIVASGNPRAINSVRDLPGWRFARRQAEAGSWILFNSLLQDAGISDAELTISDPPLRSETEIAQAIANGVADAGLGIAAVAQQFQLGFVPVAIERYDLVIWRSHYFEPPLQKLLAFCQTTAFTERAATMVGYDIARLGSVHFNGP